MYSGISWFKHPLTQTIPNPNTFGEQILISNPNAASQFEHKHTWWLMLPSCLLASEHTSLLQLVIGF